MSAALSEVVGHDDSGVLLRYFPDKLGRHHVEQRPQVSDRRRMALLKAERAVLTLWIIAEHLNISDVGMTRIADELQAIREALEVKRRDYGMTAKTERAA